MLADADHKVEADGRGNGMIDAACEAIAKATGIDGQASLDFKVSSVTGGGDALGEVVIQLDADGVRASGRGVSTDVVEAAARAYIAATNRVIRAKSRIAAAARMPFAGARRSPSWVVGNDGSRVIAGADASLGLAVADGSSVGGRDMLTPARER